MATKRTKGRPGGPKNRGLSDDAGRVRLKRHLYERVRQDADKVGLSTNVAANEVVERFYAQFPLGLESARVGSKAA